MGDHRGACERFCIAFVLALALCAASAPGALAGPTLTPLGPPFATGDRPSSIAFSPDADGQHLLVTTNAGDDSLSVFSVTEGGRLISAGAPVATGARPGSVAFSPDGRLLAVANVQGDSVSMFSTGDGGVTPIGDPEPTGDAPTSLAFSPDGRMLVLVNSAAGSVSVFTVSEVGTLTAVGTPVFPGKRPDTVAISPRGGLIVTTDTRGGSLSAFSLTPGGVLTAIGTTPAPEHPNGVTFSPDGRMLMTGNVGTDLDPVSSVSLFAVSAAGGLTAVGAAMPTGFWVDGIAFSPDGEFLALTGLFDAQIAMYSVSATGDLTEVWASTVQPRPLAVAFDPRGGLLVTANPEADSVSMFSLSAGGVLTPIGAPTPTGTDPCDVRFSPDGELLATANRGSDPASASLSVFSVSADGRLTSTVSPTPVGGRPCSLAFSPDGKLLATADGELDAVSVFSVSPAGVLTAVGVTPLGGGDGARAYAVAFSPDGSLLAVTHEDAAGGSLSTFSVSAGGALTAAESAPAGGHAAKLVFRPDGDLLAITGHDGVSLFSVSAAGGLTAVGTPLSTGEQSPSSLTFSPTGGLLAATVGTAILVYSVSAAGDLTLVETGPLLGDEYRELAFSPRGGLLVATGAESLWLFEVSATGALSPVGSPTHFSYDTNFPVVFNPAGTLLAAADRPESSLSVYPLAPPILDVAITSAPPGMTSSTSASFEFEANYPSTSQCRLDAAPFAPCTTPESQAFAGLAEGPHTFAVRATDLLDDVEPSPTSHAWIVDVTAPLDAALVQPASGAAHLRASPLFGWSPTTDNLTGVDRYELWIDALLSGAVPAASCGATCSATPAQPLADGAHSWQVRAVDGAGNVATSGSRPFGVDAAPPASFALSSPADDAATTSRRPDLSWQAAADGGIGLGGYDVVLDDQVAASGLPASATSFTPVGDLAEGVHRWYVVARDAYGNERASATRRFTIDTTPPVAGITAAPNPALAGRSITFSASGSSDAGSGIADVEWDLDGDGTFETDTGAGRSVVRSYAEPGTYAVLVRVIDRVGLTATARTDQRVTATASAAPLGVSINDAARYTRSPDVTITATWPLFASQMLVSNDGGFAAAATLPLAKATAWTLDSSGAERSSRLVYVRFRRGLTTSETYTDDIILDESRPSVTSARVALGRRAAAPRLTIRARDRGLAGVASVQVTNNRRKPLARYRPYRAKLTLVSQPGYRRLNVRKRLYVRVRDRAGNVSAWRTVQRTR
jgi:6-phosphogluconolactonase (cycloisomerase 2 family)